MNFPRTLRIPPSASFIAALVIEGFVLQRGELGSGEMFFIREASLFGPDEALMFNEFTWDYCGVARGPWDARRQCWKTERVYFP